MVLVMSSCARCSDGNPASHGRNHLSHIKYLLVLSMVSACVGFASMPHASTMLHLLPLEHGENTVYAGTTASCIILYVSAPPHIISSHLCNTTIRARSCHALLPSVLYCA